MKIVQFTASSGYGGMEKSFVDLSNALADDHNVTVVLLPGCDFRNRLSSKVTLVELVSNPTKYNPFLYYELYEKLRDISPDIVHTHGAKGTSVVHRISRFLQCKHLGTKHNDRKGRVFNSLKWVTAVSDKVKKSVSVMPGAVIQVVYNGLVEEEVQEVEKNAIFTILAVGRLDKVKGFDILIEQVQKLDFPYRLVVVGEGPEKEALVELITKQQLQDSVFLTGFSDDIAQMMHNSDTVVISSHREGFSNILVEALFYAPILLATPVGAVVEILPEQFQATQSGLGDKIADLYRNYDDYTNRFNLLRREKKSMFRQSNITEQYEMMYRKMSDLS